ncbi:PEP/pyruvate-binding domain-containing protein [candidate division CSSED10-310 bacterium]|uniref:PEP/pyruvate-binding domain-containing protein n=1 Tax=candidate division CSSED10-310 bacterium TaxID=2855610 RepID=A0ABV6Z2U6_UNCC1
MVVEKNEKSDVVTFPQFERSFFDADETFTVIGPGEIGGKAHGLAFAKELLHRQFPFGNFPHIRVTIPKLTVITTHFFDIFMAENNLYEYALSASRDERIARAFQQADLPADLVGDLWALISEVNAPLAIRSSSLLEDAKHEPFAGIYCTKMIPNNQPDTATRFRLLTEAIKFVYASTFFSSAKDYLNATQHRVEDEKMAVIIQEVVGRKYGTRCYPNISGVARSYNYYPYGHAKPEDGIVNLALGLGKTIVDGGTTWAYSPKFPKANPPYSSLQQLMKETQSTFWAVNMGKPPAFDPLKETEYLEQVTLREAEHDGTLTHIASTYSAQSDSLMSGVGRSGPRLITFGPVLRTDIFPLNAVIQQLLIIGAESLQSGIEIEFAINLGDRAEKTQFGFLQIRPMVIPGDVVSVTDQELTGDRVLVSSKKVLGNGSISHIRDIVYVKPDRFNPVNILQIASELADINRDLVESKKQFLLIGFGRWGSSDHWLGIPVTWNQINGAKVIVEAKLKDIHIDLSQGSHFFHNLTSFQVSYFSTPNCEQAIDWSWLNKQAVVKETLYVRHVRSPSCLTIKVDGITGRGVIYHE